MKRPLFTIPSAISLLLFVAVVVLWVRSHYTMDEVRFARADGRLWRVSSAKGQLMFLLWEQWPVNEPLRWRTASPALFPDLPPITSLSGDPRVVITMDPRGVHRTFYHPGGLAPAIGDWSGGPGFLVTPRTAYRHPFMKHRTLLIWLAMLPVAWLTERFVRGVLARRKGSSGLCPSCNYDLRATPDRCPECGTVRAKSSP